MADIVPERSEEIVGSIPKAVALAIQTTEESAKAIKLSDKSRKAPEQLGHPRQDQLRPEQLGNPRQAYTLNSLVLAEHPVLSQQFSQNSCPNPQAPVLRGMGEVEEGAAGLVVGGKEALAELIRLAVAIFLFLRG